MNIEEIIKKLDSNMVVKGTEMKDNDIYITCEIGTEECVCPYCGEKSNSVHSKYIRTVKDLPIQGMGVRLLLVTRKFFCLNEDCINKTFSETFEFVEPKAVRTIRLNEHINKIGLRDNSMDTVRNLYDAGIKISSSTVLRIVKKNRNNCKL